jgi:hypothetical protein
VSRVQNVGRNRPRPDDLARFSPPAVADGARAGIEEAVSGLAERRPELSAATGLVAWQRRILVAMPVLIAAAAVLEPAATLGVLLAVMAVPFLLVVALRVAALWWLATARAFPAERPLLADQDLRAYSVLVPLFREADVVDDLIAALARIDYPPSKLEIFLIVEEIDQDTRAALARAELAPHMRVIVVPDGKPRTKPRACQYALQFASGAYVVVFDAEDAPEPDQLRRAASAIAQGMSGSAACRHNSTSTIRARAGSRASSPSSTRRCSTRFCRRWIGSSCPYRSAARRTIFRAPR